MITTEFQSALHWGADVKNAAGAMVLLHSRGGSAGDMRAFSQSFDFPGFLFLAPDAPGHTWYPFPFTAPLAYNEPHLSGALERIQMLLGYLSGSGIPASRTLLFGFSQGGCLALEFAARNLGCCGAVIGLSGGRIGPLGTKWDAGDTKTGLSVFLGCGDRDLHIPIERVEETAVFFQAAGAKVEKRIYPGMGHMVNEDEIREIKRLMSEVASH